MGYAQELDDAFIDGETANIARAIGAKADAEIAALRAENERLRKRRNEIDDEAYEYSETIEVLRAENERLRELLKEADIARRALLEQKP